MKRLKNRRVLINHHAEDLAEVGVCEIETSTCTGVTDSLSITRWSMIYRLQKNISQLRSVVVMETKQCSYIVKKTQIYMIYKC